MAKATEDFNQVCVRNYICYILLNSLQIISANQQQNLKTMIILRKLLTTSRTYGTYFKSQILEGNELENEVLESNAIISCNIIDKDYTEDEILDIHQFKVSKTKFISSVPYEPKKPVSANGSVWRLFSSPKSNSSSMTKVSSALTDNCLSSNQSINQLGPELQTTEGIIILMMLLLHYKYIIINVIIINVTIDIITVIIVIVTVIIIIAFYHTYYHHILSNN
jgi:hypothetical protein